MANDRQPHSPVPCQRSGRCCSHHAIAAGALEASGGDVARWEKDSRDDILEWVAILRSEDGEIVSADFPVPPDGEEELDECPFLEWDGPHSKCGIQDTKPDVCAEFHCVTRPFIEGRAHQLAVEALRAAEKLGLIHLGSADDPSDSSFWQQAGEQGRVHDLVAEAYRLAMANDLIHPDAGPAQATSSQKGGGGPRSLRNRRR